MPVRLLAILLASVMLEPGEVGGLQVTTVAREGRVLVSCVLTDGLMDDLDKTILSGLTTTFTYETDLRRPVSIWLDRTIASTTVSAEVQFDTLTRRYQLNRSVDGRLEDSRVSDDKAAVKRFVTGFERLPLFSTGDLEPNVEYHVRVRVRIRPRVTWFFWPWDRGTATGFARFTFIP